MDNCRSIPSVVEWPGDGPGAVRGTDLAAARAPAVTVSGAADGGPGLGDVEARLETVEAVLAIHELKATYAELVDSRFRHGQLVDAEELADVAARTGALFTEDGTWDGGPALGVAVGRAAIAERLRRPTLIFSRHLFVRPRIAVAGSTATGRWELICPCTRTDGRSYLMSGFEDDTYERTAEGWLHRTMALTTVFMAPVDGGWGKVLW